MSLCCQICDKLQEKKGTYEEWFVQRLHFQNGEEESVVQILTCDACNQLDLVAMVEGYQTRIRSGRDINFH